MAEPFDVDALLDQLHGMDLGMSGEEAAVANVPQDGPKSLSETEMPDEEPELGLDELPPAPNPAPAPKPPEPVAPTQEVAPPAPVQAPPEPAEVPEWTEGAWEEYVTRVPPQARKAVEGLKRQVDSFQASEKARVDSFLGKAEKVIGAFAEARGLEVEPVMQQVQAALQSVYQAEVDQAEQRDSTSRLEQQVLTSQLQLLAYQDNSYAQSCQRNSPQDQQARQTMAQIIAEARKLGRAVDPQRAWQIAKAHHNLVVTPTTPVAAPPAPVVSRPAPAPPPPVATRTTQARPAAPPAPASRRPVEGRMGESLEDVLSREWANTFK